MTEDLKLRLSQALTTWREQRFQQKGYRCKFLGPQSICTNRAIRQIVSKCSELLADTECLLSIQGLHPCYHSDVHSLLPRESDRKPCQISRCFVGFSRACLRKTTRLETPHLLNHAFCLTFRLQEALSAFCSVHRDPLHL